MIPSKTIEELIKKHSVLEKELSSSSLEKKLFAEKSKEYSDINEIVDIAKKNFKEFHVYKPPSSRKESKENFIICKNLR